MTTFDRLNDANALPEGAVLVSENGAYFATLQSDGALRVYVSKHFVPKNVIWSSQSEGKGQGPYILRMQDDGNVVVYDKNNTPTWTAQSNNGTPGPYLLIMQPDGNLVAYANGQVLFASNSVRT